MKLASLLTQKIEFSTPAIPPPKSIASCKEAILNRWPDVVTAPPEKDRERLVQEILRKLTNDQWDDTPMSLISSAARALFDAERRSRPDLEGLREFYYAEILASTRIRRIPVGSPPPCCTRNRDSAVVANSYCAIFPIF